MLYYTILYYTRLYITYSVKEKKNALVIPSALEIHY